MSWEGNGGGGGHSGPVCIQTRTSSCEVSPCVHVFSWSSSCGLKTCSVSLGTAVVCVNPAGARPGSILGERDRKDAPPVHVFTSGDEAAGTSACRLICSGGGHPTV